LGDVSATQLEIGRIGKPHGLKGEVFVTLSTNRVERLDPGSVLTADGRALEVRHARPHQNRYVVAFVGVEDRHAAEALRGASLWADPIDDPDALWVHDLVGAEVVDTDGARVGSVEAVEANPASDLLVLDSGALVPMRFVVSGPDDGRITIDPPDGLLDL
jgi:16S rRNA processing protein RimM